MLDTFQFIRADYYGNPEADASAIDTCGQIIQAHRRITRENSPVENVVLDLSCNTGGHAVAGVYLLCWFLGDAQLSVKDSFTGAETTTVFRADINLDRKYDEQDTLAGRGLNLYCLTSPVSFSCGNLVPWAFKMDGNVKLLGSKSRGGSCVVFSMTTAWGTSFTVSGPLRISFMINGAYYDVDQGVEPDYIIQNYDHFYDREALTEFIHGLY
jgi:C-terminal processing protease CtpA/Prc